MGKISDKINGMVQTILGSAEFTSANPTFINKLLQVNAIDSPDFEQDIKDLVEELSENNSVTVGNVDDETKKEKQTIKDVTHKVKSFEKGNLGQINALTSSQMGNIRQIATDPTGFIIQTFMKKFAKGIGVIALAIIIMEAVKWIISELLKPGRMLDIRFKRDVSKEIMSFRRREEQQKLKQGFSNLIITTTSSLRGGQGQVLNTLSLVRNNAMPQIGMSTNMALASGTPLRQSYYKKRFAK